MLAYCTTWFPVPYFTTRMGLIRAQQVVDVALVGNALDWIKLLS